MSSQLYELEYRSNFRNTILDYLGDEEVYAFHPMIDGLVISNKGNVKSSIDGKFRKLQVNSNGYLGVNVKLNHKGRRFVFVHRLVMETFMSYIGIDNYFYEVNHIDANKKNNDIRNLEWLTRQENLEHSRINRLTNIKYGEESNNCKLSNQDIRDMIEFHRLGYRSSQLAESYNISKDYCSSLIRGKARRKV